MAGETLAQIKADCPFCQRISAGEYDATGVPDTVGFPPLNPVTPGHYLIVSEDHVPSAIRSPVAFGRCAQAAAYYALTMSQRGVADDWNIITSAGPAATQTVQHLHVHVVPRREGDGLHLPWTGQQT